METKTTSEPCKLLACPPGLFMFDGELCFRTEYGRTESFVVRTGEAFWGGTDNEADRAELMVRPITLNLATV